MFGKETSRLKNVKQRIATRFSFRILEDPSKNIALQDVETGRQKGVTDKEKRDCPGVNGVITLTLILIRIYYE